MYGLFIKVIAKKYRVVAFVLSLTIVISHLPLLVFAYETESKPQIGDFANAADYMTVINNGVDCTQQYKETNTIYVEKNTSGILDGIDFGNTNSFAISANVTFVKDASHQPSIQGGYGSIRLIIGNGMDNSGNQKDIELCMRPNLNHQWLLLNGNGETDVKSEYKSGFNSMGTYQYTVQYEDGKVSFWINSTLIFDCIDVTSQLNYITLQPGFHSQECDGTISNVKIWGDVEEKVCPVFNSETDVNQMERTVVTNPITNVTDKLENCGISSDATQNASFGFHGIQYGNSYNFSVNAYAKSNPEINYEGLRIKVATANKDSKLWNIEIGIRPESKMIAVFATSNNVSEVVLGEPMWNQDVSFNVSNYYSIKYKGNGVFHLYNNGVLILDNFCIGKYGYNDILPCLSVGSEQSAFVYSDMKLWGDVNVSVVSQDNYMEKVIISNPFTGITERIENCAVSTDTADSVRIDFKGLIYGESYIFSTKASFHDNNKGYEGLVFKLANVRKNDTDYDIEIRVRTNAVLIYERNNYGESVFENDIIWGKGSGFDESHTYTIEYKQDNSFDFYMDGVLLFNNYNFEEQGYTSVSPCLGIGGEVCAFNYSNMKLWGDLEFPTVPKFNSLTDKNIIEDAIVTNSLTGVTGKLKNCAVSTDKTTGGTLTLHGMQYNGSYKFTATASTADNKDCDYESLRFQVATAKKNNIVYNIEIAIRADSRMIGIFAAAKDVADEAIQILWEQPVFHNVKANYAIEYRENDCFDFYINGLYVFYNYDLTKQGYTDVAPFVGLRSELSSFDLSDIKLWGDISVLKSPEFDSETDTNLIPEVSVTDIFINKTYKLSNCTFKSDKNTTGRVDFDGVKIKANYTFYTNARFFDNKNLLSNGNEYNWEGLIFRLAKAVKDGNVYTVELRVRKDWLLLYAVDKNGNETLIYKSEASNSFESYNSYIVDYHRGGTFDFWQNGVSVLYGYDLLEEGYSNIEPAPGLGCEVCSFEFTDMKLVSVGAKTSPKIPKKPATNGDYADTMRVSESTIITYKNNTVYTNTDSVPATALFEYLPFKANETYVYGFNINVTKAEKPWMGPRIIFGEDSNGKDFSVFITQYEVLVAKGSEVLYNKDFPRELNNDYRVDLLIEPEYVTIWIDDILIIEKCKTVNKVLSKTGVLFENSVAYMSNIDLYYTDLVKYILPVIPEKPVLKRIDKDQYNAAEWMSMKLNGETYSGYFGNKLSSTDNTAGYTYIFDNLPIKDNMSYYYSATFNVGESSNTWKGPRFIFRYSDKSPMYVAVTQTGIIVIVGGEEVAVSPFDLELGKDYDIVMFSKPDSISVWLDGKCILENIDLSKYLNKGKLSAKLGLWFEMCRANITDIAIYGDEVIFDSSYVDIDLYNDKYYRMSTIPTMPKDGINLFQNIKMTDYSEGSLGALFDSEKSVLTTEYDNGTGEIVFTDAIGSNNLNGLRNGSGYVFSFNYTVHSWNANGAGESGFWMILNSSESPSTTKSNQISLGISGDALLLNVNKNGVITEEQTILFARQSKRQYNIAVVHGKNWIKLYVDNTLKMVATNLPTYNIKFQFGLNNMRSEFKDFMLYEFENSGLTVLPLPNNKEAVLSGTTIYDADEYSASVKPNLPVVLIVALGVVLVASLSGVVVIYRSNIIHRKRETLFQEGENNE